MTALFGLPASTASKKPRKPILLWDAYMGGKRPVRLEAWTKSEARAELKRRAGIGPKGRLPPYLRIERFVAK